SDKEGTRIAEHTRHVTDHACRSSYALACLEGTEVSRSVSQGFLGAIGKRCEKMVKQSSCFAHRCNNLRRHSVPASAAAPHDRGGRRRLERNSRARRPLHNAALGPRPTPGPTGG